MAKEKTNKPNLLLKLSNILESEHQFRETYSKIIVEYGDGGWSIKGERKPLIDLLRPWKG